MITLADCLNATSIDQAALHIATKVAFNRSKGYTRGIDEQTFWEFACTMDKHLRTIKNTLPNYKFSPFVETIRKRSRKQRRIYISIWQDKIVERFLCEALNTLLSDWFHPSCYAYRHRSLGIDACQRSIKTAIKTKKYFVKRDIAKYFYTIDHQILLEKLSKIIDPSDPLFKLLQNRIMFKFCKDGIVFDAPVGLPFGSPLACVLANIYLSDVDRGIEGAAYHRYADDFLLLADTADDALRAANVLDDLVAQHKLAYKPSATAQLSFVGHPEFPKCSRIKFLGLEFLADGNIKLPVEKQRKVINFYKRSLKHAKTDLRKLKNIDDRLEVAITSANEQINKRIRSVAIIDYYLRHITDEHQLRNMDRIIAEMVISAVTGNPFKKKDFRIIPFKKLRDKGLMSLLHRRRLVAHGHIKTRFMSKYNKLMVDRFEAAQNRRQDRINKLKIARKINAAQDRSETETGQYHNTEGADI